MEVDPLLMPTPITMFKDDIPASLLHTQRSSEHSFATGKSYDDEL